MRDIVCDYRRNESGAMAIVGALTIGCVLIVTAAALTYGEASSARSKTQHALDAAVLAAAAAPYEASDDQRISIAQAIYTEVRARESAPQINIQGGSDPKFRVSNMVVYGDVEFELKSAFLGVLGRDSIEIGVGSAARKQRGQPACVLGLDPTEAATMDFNGRASLDVVNCAAQANSTDGSGMRQVGQPTMRAAEIGVTGGYSGEAYSPPPIKGTTPIPDPLASLPQPAPGPCHAFSNAKFTNETVRLTPGTYCGGLTVLAGSTATLDPGVYIMKDGPLTIQANAIVTGREVMIAFIGETSTLYMIGQATLDVTSPASGPYMNIQFFGDRNVYGKKKESLWFTLLGDSVLKYDGVLYAPSFHLWFAGGSVVHGKSPNYLAIAKKLWFQDHTNVQMEMVNTRDLDVVDAVKLEYGAALYR